MPLEERRARSEGLRRAVEGSDVIGWFEDQIADMLRYETRLQGTEDELEEDLPLPSNIVPLTGTDRH